MNGEIYNHAELRSHLTRLGHAFRGGGDTEVVAHAFEEWGNSTWPRLEGMFAIAVLDAKQWSLHLARDAAGEKPLYYSTTDENVHFASESSVLARVTEIRDIDPTSLAAFAKFGSVRGERTMYAGVLSLEPGTVKTWDLTSRRFKSAYNFTSAGHPADVEIAGGSLRAGIEAAVMKSSRADVPGALLLSGGLDSALLAGVLQKSGVVNDAFTLHYTDGGYDELEQTKATARHYGLKLHIVESNAADFATSVVSYLDCIDQPTVDGLNVFAATRSISEAGLKLAFTGVGSDELFGGYSTFKYMGLPQVPRPIYKLLDRHMINRPDSKVKKAWIGASARHRGVTQAYDDLRSLEPYLWKACATRELSQPWPSMVVGAQEISRTVAELEVRRYLVDTLLRDADIASMRNGVELRAPFLHPDILRLAAVVGPTPSKSGLRSAFAADLPQHLRTASKKKGFAVPLGAWMISDAGRRTMAELMDDVPLEDAGFIANGTGNMMADLLQKNLDRPRHYSTYLAIYGYVVLNRWYRRNISAAA